MSTKTKKPIVFKLHGQAFDPTGQASIFLKIGRFVKFLDGCEDGELLDSAELSGKCGCGPRGLSDYSPKLREDGYAVKLGAKNYYGNKKSIAALKTRIEE